MGARAFRLVLSTLALAGVAAAQSTQEWTVLIDDNFGGPRWTMPGPVAVDAQGIVLTTAHARESTTGGSQFVNEFAWMYDSAGNGLCCAMQSTTNRETVEIVASPTGGFLLLSSFVGFNGLRLTLKFPDNTPNPAWGRTFSTYGYPQPHDLVVDAQGTAYISGVQLGSGGVMVAAVDRNSFSLWTKQFYFGAGTASEAFGLALSGDGALYLRSDVALTSAPYTRTLHVTKLLASTGSQQWTRAVPGITTTGNGMRSSRAIHADGGGVVIGGETETAGPVHPGFIARYDSAGNLQWTREIPGSFADACFVDRIAPAPDGTLWALSLSYTSNSPPPLSADAIVSRLDPQGALLSNVTYRPPTAFYSYGAGLIVGSTGQAWIPATVFLHPQPNVTQVSSHLALFDPTGSLVADQVFDATQSVNDETLFTASEGPNHRLLITGGEGQTVGDRSFVTQLDLEQSPQGYCTAKVNSLGCTPALTFTGAPSATANQGFSVRVANVRDNKPGLYLYSLAGPAAVPFQGGTLCLQGPVKRTTPMNSGGAGGCTGIYQLDFNAFAHGALGGSPSPALLVAGTLVDCQAWGRDPGFPAPNSTTLSSGLAYVVLP